jgi:ABC-type nitrate/sulfonate/bicarbonate transport system substrate-binding protein
MKVFLALLLLMVTLQTGMPRRVAAADADQTIRVSLNPVIYNNLPILMAADKGYFAQQHLNVVITKINQSAATIIPLLARGDIDIAQVVTAPAFFNAYTQGFNLKVVASVDSEKVGWSDVAWVLVRQDLWDAGSIRKPADLRGKNFDSLATGAPVDFIARTELTKAGLTTADLTYTQKLRTQEDVFTALRNKAVDVVMDTEPSASQLEAQGLAHKWLPQGEIAPFYQDGYVGVSATFLANHRDAVARFLTAFVRAQREIAAANAKWTPAALATVVKWSDLPEDVIKGIPGPAYTGGLGKIDTSSIDRQQQMWLALKLVDKPVPVASIVDDGPLRVAYKALGLKY